MARCLRKQSDAPGAQEAQKSAKAARVLLLGGALLYGKSIARGQTANREFLFRRITTLSLYTFGILALLSEADQKQRAGGLESGDVRILEYFVAEAKEELRKNRPAIRFEKGKTLFGIVSRKIFRCLQWSNTVSI